jgi:hypothetical protein
MPDNRLNSPSITNSPFGAPSTTFISGRVKDIILDNKHEKWKPFGEWNSIGTIAWEDAKNPNFSSEINWQSYAYPLFPNIKHYPLKNEIIHIIYLVDSNASGNTNSVVPYYLPPLNLWNSQVHNAIPSAAPVSSTSNSDYESATIGAYRRITPESPDIPLGNTFNEDNTIKNHPLLPYEGDILYEGRFGNSIRLGATVKNAVLANTWSTEGTNGDPITIIRNGQGTRGVTNTNEPWVPTVEDINPDKSSIYMTSTQKIKLFPACILKDSFQGKTPPTDVDAYTQNQIILNSGRLVFNAKTDSILLLSEKSIHLASDTSVNVDANDQIVLNCRKVILGSTVNTESAVMGEALMSNLKALTVALSAVGDALTTHTTILGPAPALTAIGPVLKAACESLKTSIDGKVMLSNKVNIAK